jgi:hypothetical protein
MLLADDDMKEKQERLPWDWNTDMTRTLSTRTAQDRQASEFCSVDKNATHVRVEQD